MEMKIKLVATNIAVCDEDYCHTIAPNDDDDDDDTKKDDTENLTSGS